MSLQIGVPREFQSRRPLGSSETRFIYTGARRYNVDTKTLSAIEVQGDKLIYTETPYTGTILSRGYATELVRVIVYSESPRIWAEELSPDVVHFFMQKVQHPETT